MAHGDLHSARLIGICGQKSLIFSMRLLVGFPSTRSQPTVNWSLRRPLLLAKSPRKAAATAPKKQEFSRPGPFQLPRPQLSCGRCTIPPWSDGRRVMHLHVLIARRSVLTKTSLPIVFRAAPDPAGVGESRLGDLDDPAVQHLSRRYGRAYIDRLQRWGAMLGEGPCTLRWMSTLQLYLLFCMTWAVRPPVLRNGVWVDTGQIQNGQYVEHPLAQRVKWFQQTLRQYAKRSSGQWLAQEVRPTSTSLQARLTCVTLRISNALWLQVEQYLSENLVDGAVRSHQRTWTTLPTPVGTIL